jgi:excisionase family DNA binding protein
MCGRIIDYSRKGAIMIEFRVGRLAKQLGVHRNTVRNWIKTGSLDARHGPGNRYVIETDAFARFLENQQDPGRTIAELTAQWSRTPISPRKRSNPTPNPKNPKRGAHVR